MPAVHSPSVYGVIIARVSAPYVRTMLVTTAEIERVVLDAVRNLNLARPADSQMAVSADAPLFGPDSPLDSLGLVSLLIDIEEALSDRGFDVTLGDAKAMSRSASPFRSVPVLVDYIQNSLSTT
jgi:acyl carrier protein